MLYLLWLHAKVPWGKRLVNINDRGGKAHSECGKGRIDVPGGSILLKAADIMKGVAANVAEGKDKGYSPLLLGRRRGVRTEMQAMVFYDQI